MSEYTVQVQVTMNCGCVNMFVRPIPEKGDQLYCIKHERGVTIVKVSSKPWRLRCRTCTRSMTTGQSELEAVRLMNRHVGFKPTHTADVYSPAGTVVHSSGPEHNGMVTIQGSLL